ncbi:serine/threonine-protein kinase PINK1, mitochondrial [Rhinoraja longicauda]
MSLRTLLTRGWRLGRSALRLVAPAAGVRPGAGILRPAVRLPPLRYELPARYRYFRHTVGSLAAQLQRQAARRLRGPRGALLAFGLGLGLVEQRVEEARAGTAACEEIQTLFKRKKIQYEKSIPLSGIGHCLEDYEIGHGIGKGCNAAVHKAFIPEVAIPKPSSEIRTKETPPESKSEGVKAAAAMPDVSSVGTEITKINSPLSEEKSSLSFVVLERDPPAVSEGEASHPHSEGNSDYPLALKMLFNINAGSSTDAILRTMGKELVPTIPNALAGEFGTTKGLVLPYHYNREKLKPHPNIIQIVRAFTAKVPLLPGAWVDYPDVLPTSLNPNGVGLDRTLFLVMKCYPCTLKQYLQVCTPWSDSAVLMILQLLEGVDHLVQHNIAHRDLKTDNILVEFDSVGCPRLVITDFGCCLVSRDNGLKLPFTSMEVDRGGNACLMAPEISTAVPGPRVTIDYSRSDAWAVGTLAYEILGFTNPFYQHGAGNLESRSYDEDKLPPLPSSIHTNVRLVLKLLLCRDPKRRLSARVAANMLHLHQWGAELLASDEINVERLFGWLQCQTLLTSLQVAMNCGSTVQTELRRNFLANLNFEQLNLGLHLLLSGRNN